jgi:mono/diheme cytochrome c family protein
MKLPIPLAALALATLAVASLAAPAAPAPSPAPAPQRPSEKDAVALGRYLVKTTGCNDCHTAGYAASGGQVAEKDWLQGDALGWRGPWGTSYASNLRLYFANLSEAQWLAAARTMQARPPMPWFGLRDMSDTDLRAIYRYVKAQGPAGRPAPAALPPGVAPQGPFVQFPQ